MPTSIKKHRRVKKRPARSQPKVPPRSQQLLIRTSERSAFEECKHAWQWGYIDGRKAIHEAPQLSFGSLIHAALEKRYPPGLRRGSKPAETFEKLYEAHTKEAFKLGFRDEDDKWMEAGALGVDMLEHYVEHYGRDEEWEVIASEQTFAVPVFEPCVRCMGRRDGYNCSVCKDSGQIYLFTYVGTLDGVWKNRIDSGVRINDYKTTAKDPTLAVKNPGYTGALDSQRQAYWTWGVDYLIEEKILKPRQVESLDGMLYTFLRKAMRDDRPQNDEGYFLNQDDTVSKKQPAPFFHRELTYCSAAERERTRTRAIRQVKRMIELREGPPEDRRKSPHWLICNMCQFKDPCELQEMGSDYQALLDGMYEDWDPYSAHEIEVEGK